MNHGVPVPAMNPYDPVPASLPDLLPNDEASDEDEDALSAAGTPRAHFQPRHVWFSLIDTGASNSNSFLGAVFDVHTPVSSSAPTPALYVAADLRLFILHGVSHQSLFVDDSLDRSNFEEVD